MPTLPPALPANESWWGALGDFSFLVKQRNKQTNKQTNKKLYIISGEKHILRRIQSWVDSIGKRIWRPWNTIVRASERNGEQLNVLPS